LFLLFSFSLSFVASYVARKKKKKKKGKKEKGGEKKKKKKMNKTDGRAWRGRNNRTPGIGRVSSGDRS